MGGGVVAGCQGCSCQIELLGMSAQCGMLEEPGIPGIAKEPCYQGRAGLGSLITHSCLRIRTETRYPRVHSLASPQTMDV